jgi:hypothetical protein
MDSYSIKRLGLRISAAPRRAWHSMTGNAGPDALFIWIPKSAGTSVFTALSELGMRKFKSIDKTRHLFTGHGMATFSHLSVPMLVRAGAVDAAYVSRAFKFAFVRNPYDRCASLYRYYIKMGRIPADTGFPAFLTQLEEEFRHKERPHPAPEAMSAKLRYYGEEFHHGRGEVWPVGLYNSLEWSQCRPQCDWLDGFAPGNDILVGRVETLDADFKTVLDRLHAMAPQLDFSKLKVPRMNTTEKAGDSGKAGFFADPAHRRIVEFIHAADFERFGY